MRVLISSVGTRGDVQPALALALEMRALVYAVRMCVPPNFVAWAREFDFEARPLGVEMRAPRAGASTAQVAIPDLIADQFNTIETAASDCDAIIGAGVHQYAARSVAERHAIPCFIAAYAPVSLPSSNLVPPGIAEMSSDPTAIQQLWNDTRQAWDDRALTRVNANRIRLGLAPIDDVIRHIVGERVWLAADRTLGPAPATSGLQVIQTGAWMLSDSRPLPAELETFLEEGEPPVYVGLGSMPAPEGTAAMLIAAARLAGRRVVLSRGWADLQVVDSGPDCMVVDEVNQQALFPRLAAVVHHGGAGTTTTAE